MTRNFRQDLRQTLANDCLKKEITQSKALGSHMKKYFLIVALKNI